MVWLMVFKLENSVLSRLESEADSDEGFVCVSVYVSVCMSVTEQRKFTFKPFDVLVKTKPHEVI